MFSLGFNIVKIEGGSSNENLLTEEDVATWKIYCGKKTRSACNEVKEMLNIQKKPQVISREIIPYSVIGLDYIIFVTP